MLIAISSASLALLLGLTCLLVKTHRRLKHLETQQSRATMHKLTNTPPPDGGCGLAAELLPPRPARRRCHLSLYRGGGAAAALIAIGVAVRATAAYTRHSVVFGATAATVAAAGVATTVYVAPSPGEGQVARPTATATSAPLSAASPAPPRRPNAAPSPKRSEAPSPTASTSKAPRPTSRPPSRPPQSRPAPSVPPRRNLPSHRDLPAEVGVTVAPRDPEKAPLVEAEVQDARLCVRATALKLVAAKVCAGR